MGQCKAAVALLILRSDLDVQVQRSIRLTPFATYFAEFLRQLYRTEMEQRVTEHVEPPPFLELLTRVDPAKFPLEFQVRRIMWPQTESSFILTHIRGQYLLISTLFSSLK